jgi:signal peptidase II
MKQLANFKYRISGILVAFFVCVADQWTKSAVKAFMNKDPDGVYAIVKNHVNLVFRHNTGGAFSMLDQHPRIFLYLPSGLIVLVFVLLLFSKDRRSELPGILGLGCILGGALGNMADRIREPAIGVFDFIDVYAGAYHWPAFNLADSCIVLGVFLFGYALMRSELARGR